MDFDKELSMLQSKKADLEAKFHTINFDLKTITAQIKKLAKLRDQAKAVLNGDKNPQA